MLLTIVESTIIGFITCVIGTIIFNLTINKINKDENKPHGINIAFFITGIFLYLIFEKRIFNNLLHKK